MQECNAEEHKDRIRVYSCIALRCGERQHERDATQCRALHRIFIQISRFWIFPIWAAWEMAFNLLLEFSSPHGNSVNDDIQIDLCSHNCRPGRPEILCLGQGILLAKIDI